MVNSAPVKRLAVEPLRLGRSVGAALALLGVADCVPLLHGAQGCAEIGAGVLGRHFRRNLLVRSVAMNDLSTALGGWKQVERTLLAIQRDSSPRLIGIVSGSAAEASGDDLDTMLARYRHGAGTDFITVSAPDFTGSLQDGWSAATTRLVRHLAQPADTIPNQIAVLPGSHLTPADILELKAIIAAFGLTPIVLPDISRAISGRVAGSDEFAGVSYDDVRNAIGRSRFTVAIGEQMRPAAEALRLAAGIRFELFDRLTGLISSDALIRKLAELSGQEPPVHLKEQRAQLIDVMLDCRTAIADRRVVVSAEADHAFVLTAWLRELGVRVPTAIVAARGPMLDRIEAETTLAGDLDDFARAAGDADLLIGPTPIAKVAARLRKPLWRCGLPVTDRWDAPFQTTIGYRGTRELLFIVASLLACDEKH